MSDHRQAIDGKYDLGRLLQQTSQIENTKQHKFS